MLLHLLSAGGFVITFLLAACSKNEDPQPQPEPQPTTYRGVLAGKSGETGTLTLTITPATAMPNLGGTRRRVTDPVMESVAALDHVTGRVKMVGQTATEVTGLLDTSNGHFTASGNNFDLDGILSGGRVSGTYVHASFQGGFNTYVPSSSSYTAYCGSWNGSDASHNPDHGAIAFVVEGLKIMGQATNADGSTSNLSGDLNASDHSIICTFQFYTVTGNIFTDGTAEGHYTSTLGGGRSGTWTASSFSF